MPANRIINISRVESNPVEPVTLVQVKAKLIITFTDDDTLLTQLITSCRQMVENSCNISICTYIVTMIADLFKEWVLPYGPVIGIQSVATRTGTEGSGPGTYATATEGWSQDADNFIPSPAGGFNPGVPFTGHFQWGPYADQCSDRGNRYRLVYMTGMTAVPKDLCDAILNQIAYDYEHRGEEVLAEKNRGLCAQAEDKAGKFRVVWL